MVLIDMAERAGVRPDGSTGVNEDKIIVLPHAVILLHGAPGPCSGRRSGGWYAENLGDGLRRILTAEPEIDLAAALRTAIRTLTTDHGLTAGNSPSSTVAMARWTGTRVDALVLADSPVVAFTIGDVQVVRDTRSAELPCPEGGSRVAETDPTAADRAIQVSWPQDQVQSVLLASNGVSCGVDEYGLFPDWTAVLDQALEEGLTAVLDTVREAENADSDDKGLLRPVHHRDQALALVHFEDDWSTDFR